MAELARNVLTNTKIKVDRQRLLLQLRNNRDKHLCEYREAVAGYKAEAEKKLTEAVDKTLAQLEKSRAGIKQVVSDIDPEQPDTFKEHFTLMNAITLNLPIPRCYTAEYDAAIAMMEWEVEDQVYLEYPLFQCFVRDQWDWTSGFKALHLNYSGKM